MREEKVSLEMDPKEICKEQGFDEYETLQGYEYITEYADEHNPHGLAIANTEDKFTYRNITARPTWAAMLIIIVEFAERASYYGTTGVLNNFIMRPLPLGSKTGKVMPGHIGNAGALGLGLQDANAITTLLEFLAHVVPLFGGYLADDRLGKFKTIMIGVWVGILAHFLFIIAALPPVIAKGQPALAPVIFGILTLAICTGFIKANLLPLLLEQFPYRTNVLKRTSSGEVVYIDRDSSIQRLTMFYYWSVDIGAFLSIATSYSAKRVGYWLSFLVPMIMYFFVIIAMLLIKPHLKPEIPQGSLLKKALLVVKTCLKGNFIKRLRHKQFWAYAFPSNMEARGVASEKIKWTQEEVKDYRITFTQCILFAYFVIFNIADVGLGSTLTAQAGAMSSKGIPNDFFNNFNAIVVIVTIPFLDYIFYPQLSKFKISFKRVHKVFVGFMFAAIASMVSAIIQWKVYETSPCGYYATTCDEPSPLSAWLEIINYGLCAIGECFCYTTGYEIAYTRAPDNGKSLVMAIFMFNAAISSAINEGITGALYDLNLIKPFAGVAGVGAFCAFAFLIQYWNLDETIEEEERERERLKQKQNSEMPLEVELMDLSCGSSSSKQL